MKQFQKIGVAAAVASIAAGAVATEVSQKEAGDLAIVPYYTVNGGYNTGIHVINTTDSTQVVKVRLRRGADSKDALDFNLVMSPRDEWTANIGAGGSTGVQVTTNDTTCTVPEFPNGVAQMPDTYSEGATEGYVEIIAMGQAASEKSPLAVGAKHKDGVPADCDAVRDNFYRVDAANVGKIDVRGVHTSAVLSNGSVSAGVTGAFTANISVLEDSSDEALKVSYFITDSAGGLEFGDNAVMVQGFNDAPMATNQQPLSFGTDGKLDFDPLNFELPNLAYGAYDSSVGVRTVTAAAQPGLAANVDVDRSADAEAANGGTAAMNSGLFDDLRGALTAEALINDWANFETADATVKTDWVVTLPGQYTMVNQICDTYDSYSLAATACSTAVAAIDHDQNQLPLVLASSTTTNPLSGTSNLTLWDREELNLNAKDPVVDTDLGFSPGGSAGTPTNTITLDREVNVLSFDSEGMGVLESADLQSEDLGLRVVVNVEGGDRGWGQLAIQSEETAARWYPSATDDGDNVNPNEDATDGYGSFMTLATDDIAVVGFAVWERSFADQAGNYGRAIEHTTVTSAAGRNADI